MGSVYKTKNYFRLTRYYVVGGSNLWSLMVTRLYVVWLSMLASVLSLSSRATLSSDSWLPVRIMGTDRSRETLSLLLETQVHIWRFELKQNDPQDIAAMEGLVYEEINQTTRRGWARLIMDPRRIIPGASALAGSFEGEDGIWHLHQVDSQLLARKESRSSLRHQVRSAQAVNLACGSLRQIAWLDIAVDSAFAASFASKEATKVYTLGVVDQASQLWESTFNISLAVRTLEFGNSSQGWDRPCQSSRNSKNVTDYDTSASEQAPLSSLRAKLEALTTWRSGAPQDTIATWVLFTACMSGDVIGISWEGSACKNDAGIVVQHTLLDYRVLSHELGHIFGAVHDCDNVTCASVNQGCCRLNQQICDAQGRFIMNPESTPDQSAFSPCSKDTICSSIANGSTNTGCLVAQSESGKCAQLLGSPAALTCNSSKPCLLACTQPGALCTITNTSLPDGMTCALDPTRNGVCSNGVCVVKRLRTWIWVVILVVSLSCLIGIALGGICFAKRRMSRPPIDRKQISGPIHSTNSVHIPITQ